MKIPEKANLYFFLIPFTSLFLYMLSDINKAYYSYFFKETEKTNGIVKSINENSKPEGTNIAYSLNYLDSLSLKINSTWFLFGYEEEDSIEIFYDVENPTVAMHTNTRIDLLNNPISSFLIPIGIIIFSIYKIIISYMEEKK